MFVKKILLPLLLLFSVKLVAQTDSIAGIWKGTSICQVKNSPCHDEIVVYHISKTDSNKYSIQANKIVNKQEEDMGTLESVYDPAKKILTSIDTYKNRWDFKITGSTMDGTLYYKGVLFRIIQVKKEK